jgi:hypothetical protein
MLLRQALLAAILVSGTAAAAAAQSDEFPFRRFRTHAWDMPRGETHRFFMRDNERFRDGAARMRFRIQERGHEMADRMRLRGFDGRDLAMRMRNREFDGRDMAMRMRNWEFNGRDIGMRMRNRGFALRDEARRNRTEFRFRDRDMDRMGERLRNRMDHFRFERPMMRHRRSATI